MKIIFLITGLIGSAFAFSDAPARPWFIDKMVGCFQVTYHYQETGREAYRRTNKEWITFENGDDGSSFLIHNFSRDGKFSPHWGHRWAAKPGNRYEQKVYDIDLSTVRYQCTANGSTFEPDRERGISRMFMTSCDAQRVPHPIRDTGRTDYARLDRTHIYRMTDSGFSDVQRNTRYKEDGTFVSTEEGWNEYRRLTPRDCGQE